jgi:hypothetical protein
MNWALRKTIGQVGISLVLIFVSVGTADALTGLTGTVGVSDHDEAAPHQSDEGEASGDENSDQYRDSEVDDEESDTKRDETLIDIVWNVLD